MEQKKEGGGRKREACGNQAVRTAGDATSGPYRGNGGSGHDADVVYKAGSPQEREGEMLKNKRGMEMVQVAILIALAVALGLIFRTQITEFVNNTFADLNS